MKILFTLLVFLQFVVFENMAAVSIENKMAINDEFKGQILSELEPTKGYLMCKDVLDLYYKDSFALYLSVASSSLDTVLQTPIIKDALQPVLNPDYLKEIHTKSGVNPKRITDKHVVIAYGKAFWDLYPDERAGAQNVVIPAGAGLQRGHVLSSTKFVISRPYYQVDCWDKVTGNISAQLFKAGKNPVPYYYPMTRYTSSFYVLEPGSEFSLEESGGRYDNPDKKLVYVFDKQIFDLRFKKLLNK